MIRLLICEDVSVLRAGLVALLSRPADFWVVTQLENSDELLPVATITQPDADQHGWLLPTSRQQ